MTAVRNNGFWMQDPSPDGNADTSEGIFVFRGTGVSVGDADGVVRVVLDLKAEDFVSGAPPAHPVVEGPVPSPGGSAADVARERAASQRSDRQHHLAVPVEIEDRAGLICRRTQHPYVEIAKIRLFVSIDHERHDVHDRARRAL